MKNYESLLNLFFISLYALALFLPMAASTPGCALFTEQVTPAPIPGSTLQKYVPDLESADFVLCLTNLQAIEEGVYTREEAQYFFSRLSYLVEQPMTYQAFAKKVVQMVAKLNSRSGRIVVLVSAYMGPISGETAMINDVDRELIRQHIQHQRERVLALF